MPPHSFMEWVVGQNVVPRPKKEHTTKDKRRSVFQLELETDNAAEKDTLRLTYPRTGRSSTKRPTTTRVQTNANKAVHFNEDDGKIEVKSAAVQTKPQPKPQPKPKHKSQPPQPPQPQPQVDTVSSTFAGPSGDKEIAEVIEDCPCANCVEAQNESNRVENLSKGIKDSIAAVHAKHVYEKSKARLAEATESAKAKSSTKKHKPKTKAKKPEKPDSEGDTTESESGADTDTESEEESWRKKKKKSSKKNDKKSGKKGKDDKKKPDENLKNDQDEEADQSRKAIKGSVEVQRKDSKGYEKSDRHTNTTDDNEAAFDVAMRYNRMRQKELDKEVKAIVEEDDGNVGEKLKALMERFTAEKKAMTGEEKLKYVEAKLKAAEEKRKIEKKERALARAKEEKARIKAELKAKAKAEAEAAKPLPPPNSPPKFRQTRFVLPPESRVMHVEHTVEDSEDPHPNAFYDNKNGIMRVYHGPAYGNPNGVLYPKNRHNDTYRRLSVGTPHPQDNVYYNGFQGSPYGQPAPAPIPTQGYPPQQHNPSRAEDWFQGYGSIPIGKGPNYENEVDDSLYEREVRKACYPSPQLDKANPALGVSDQGGRSNVNPTSSPTDKNVSTYYVPKDSGPKDKSQKSDSGQKTSKDDEQSKSTSKRWDYRSRGSSKNQDWCSRKNQDWEGSKNNDWGCSEAIDWGVPSPVTNENRSHHSHHSHHSRHSRHSHRPSSNKSVSSDNPWGGDINFDWEKEVNSHDSPAPASPASISSIENGSIEDKRSSHSSNAGSTHARRTKHLPGSWFSPANSHVSGSRPPGTIPDNVGPDLVSSMKKQGRSNKKKGKEGWIDAEVAQTSGGVFDKDDDENAEGGRNASEPGF
ncbi:hypothetical protein F5B19DRAFT_37566 [Rostrohypoxylon terebratum]|nr:hypothetical protein F5B19DRAFT_37566 [Rostrohypoxylon terebratum]